MERPSSGSKDGAPAGESPVQIGPVKRFGKYTLIKKLATGGMAEIWLSRQGGIAGFNRFVVIKKILSHLAEEETFRNMFLDEAKMSAQLTHPNIVQVYDFGEADGTYYIAMEFISGENLAAIAWRGVKRKKPLSPTFAARIIADACKALNYAHHLTKSDGTALEIVHRDISPQNILVTYEGEIKVVDFGIAKAATKSQHTKTGMLKGKFSYMSPEQCLGEHVDMRSDVFALGIVCYELCTGKRLFKHESELMILEMITKRRITPPSEVSEGISPELEGIIMKALEKNREDRYQTGQEFALALDDYLRRDGASSSNADIAEYMRSLFGDKIEEKRQIMELASREDLETAFGDDESTEQAIAAKNGTKRKVVHGRQPSVQVRGLNAPAVAGGPGYVPGMPHPGQLTGGLYPSTSGMLPFQSQSQMMSQSALVDTRSKAPMLVIIVATLVIVLAGIYLYIEIFSKPATAVKPADTPKTQVGKIEIDSTPSGALILVDGKRVPLENGEWAKTPIEQLTNLQYSKTYSIRLEKDGYKPVEQQIEMGAQWDGKPLRIVLTAIPGRLIINVAGDSNSSVKILVNGIEQGYGPAVTRELEPGPKKVEGVLDGYRCTSDPASITVEANRDTIVSLRCEKGPPPRQSFAGGSTGGTRVNTGGNTEPPKPKQPAQSGDCIILPDQPPGFVTINTEPYSTIFYGDKKLGETPLAKIKLPSGCLKIRADNKEANISVEKVIRVEPNKTLRYQFDLANPGGTS